MKRKALTAALMSVLASVLVVVPAHANGSEDVTVSFFHSPNADARWAQFTPAPPGDPDTWSIRLRLGTKPGTCLAGDLSCYAGADLKGLAGPAPTTAPTYDYYSTAAATPGSPRLVVQFSSPANTTLYIDLRPVATVAGSWVTEGTGATASDWDLMNQGVTTCPGFLYEQTYAALVAVIQACDSGAAVTDVFVVTDSSWGPGPYTQYIDNISYGDAFITSPEGAGCHEGDGDGRFHGNHGDGDFHFNGDGCLDGDKDQVTSSNRGDGKDFQSASIDSISVNSLGNTMTMTGTGTSGGAPVTFVLVAVESTALTPGTVSMTFSDGYTNAGTLLDGSITLH